MLNIDGVYHGNYRSDCVGQNINRTYGLTDEKFIINKSVMEFVAELKRKGQIHLVGQHVVENGLMPKQIMAYIEQKRR